ncbi:phosphonate C-P lyase system protein PhnH [Dyella psychrodurans]|uniref:Phosphonate C-P lyase system protein PhnH n=1 Tax=Dyella psychrodurans TaxID=1927960 RepID=A0A370WVJ8_9GAMM|nr:phosphonate C-P lyase system protein PhnH [Dyella psychrodurans]RDS80056.1 phosphonate C-P lyase system protein PhnH [Dyella psychrodurans]
MMLAAFANPVFDSQRTFRELLQAMARPAVPRPLPVLPPSPAPIASAAMAIVLTLCDATTSVWLQQPEDEAVRHVRFHAGLKLVEQPQDADFALITDPVSMPPLEAFARGDMRYPDRSASLIIQAAAISSSPCVQGEVGKGPLALASTQDSATPPQPSPASRGGSKFAGPGIRDTETVAIDGLPGDFWQQRTALAAQLPLGIDLFFVAGQQVLALPRTTRLLEG